ncbi:hypothetical protein FNV43_RR10182 [Rhamnella rubrinervis]|uniref:C2H2-type domain-containing protein n=1 Tax=Rhamnella rubrinervis TaxID=2594499 RepID=A0A8K0HC48_9ROSA|nr:hypothetical protein FNV43_RR10182 [Rhamnella rubrinervis]
MATELGLLSLTQLQKLAQSQDNIQNQDYNQLASSIPSAWMWNPKQAQEEEDSWEVRAFAEDTGNVMGTTWPPRSYTCTFCRREFRSAQALGGHMNVHRRDRARLHQVVQPNSIINVPAAASSSSSTTTSSFLIPTQEFVASGGGLCLLYQFTNPGSAFPPTTLNACIDSPSTSPSTLLSISPYPPRNFMMTSACSPSVNLTAGPQLETSASDHCQSIRADQEPSAATDNGNEELDLELRLGHGPTPTS